VVEIALSCQQPSHLPQWNSGQSPGAAWLRKPRAKIQARGVWGADPAAAASAATPDQLSALWRRLKEYRIAQWSVGYVAVAYGIQHAVTLTSEALEWPHGIERASMILLALGLPVAVALGRGA